MAFITNGGAKLIQRAVQESKAIVFGSVRMNTIYESNASELVQKSDNWYGESVGQVVGCLSHVSVDGVSCVCDSKLAIQCNDNSKPWKSIGVYGNIEGESGEILIACESIQNGDYKNVTLVELPVTLDGAVEDFGIQGEGGGGGGGGDVPENMMTTNTVQFSLSGMKRWELQTYTGSASADNPDKYDLLNVSRADIGNLDGSIVEGRPVSYPIECSNIQQFRDEYGWVPGAPSFAKLSPLGVLQLNSGEILDEKEHVFSGGDSVEITPNGIQYQNPNAGISNATWSNIINAANGGGGGADIRASQDVVQDDGDGNLIVFGDTIQPDSDIQSTGIRFTFNSSGYLESVSSVEGVATIGLIVRDSGGSVVANGRISGLSLDGETPLTFQSPIQLLEGYTITYQAIFSSI